MTLADGITSLLAAKFLFFPLKVIEVYPSQLQIPYEEVYLKSDDGLTLHGWFFPGKRDKTLLYLHGNAGNIGDRLDKLQFLKQVGWNIFIFDYRGYGGSEGIPTLEGVRKDGNSAFRYLLEKREIPAEQIILFGESLGAALATDIASREPVGAVILESAFTTLREIAQSAYPFIPGVAVPDVYRSVDLIKKARAPILVIHGKLDEIIPFEMGKKLFESAPHPKKFYPVSEAHHNDVYQVGKGDYLKQIENFLSAVGLP